MKHCDCHQQSWEYKLRNVYAPFIEISCPLSYMCYKELDKRFRGSEQRHESPKKARIEATILNSLTPIFQKLRFARYCLI